MDLSLSFEKIIPSSFQIKTLYKVLQQREYSISNEGPPSFQDHKDFVSDHPYRHWYLIYKKSNCIGSVYVHYDNSIGINIVSSITTKTIDQILVFIKQTLKPLKPVSSLRYKDFFLNVPIKNRKLQSALGELGYTSTQISFVLRK